MEQIKSHRLIAKIHLLKGVYVNNALNRRLGRVGKVYGKQKEELSKVRYKMVTEEQSNLIPDTYTRHFIDGAWTPRRSELHRKILNSYTSNKPTQEKPKAILLAGGGGSGKSFIYESKIKGEIGDHESFVYLNSDDVKEELPEYNILLNSATNIAASKTHEESSYIVKEILSDSISKRQNLVYDAVLGNPYRARELVENLKRSGYEVELHYVDTKLNIAKRSATLRFERSGRFVPMGILSSANISARETFKSLRDSSLISRVVKYDNSGQLERKEPKVERIKG